MLRTASRGAWVLALRSQTLARAVPQAGLDVVPGFEEERASGEIDRRLGEAASSGGAEGVAKLVDAEGGGFSEANVARAFRAFAETLKPGADFTAVSKHPGFQVLIDMVLSGMSRYPTATLAQVIYDCGRLGVSEDMLLDEVARHLMDKIPDMAPPELVSLASGYAGVAHSPSILLFQAISERLREEGAGLEAELKTAANEAFAELGYTDLKPF
ncbi:hypothetical protein F751_3844 [Auxenochlorella protothecoides]|uniref:Uncharacterized protein n=1 Tax=Auxenochlorella protothecoides TaxID=3075 RepID=A0A087SRI0_AUXPR|nr:hypothetical protein F751_3844 [Auxenochlorella protothecoides]KFM28334.1 hypothetical protein F751_3844 [Auxenochlorella protothecoides]